MRCRDIVDILAAGKILSEEAHHHVAACQQCQALLQATAFAMEAEPLSEDAKERLGRIVTTDLRPVRPLRPGLYSLIFLLFAIGATAVGVLTLGQRGWRLATLAQEWWIVPGLLVLAATIPAALARLMVPGALLRLRIRDFLAVMVCWFALAAPVVYPVHTYPAFAKSAVACLFIGLGFAAAVVTASWITLQRGFVTSPRLAAVVAGALGGTSSLALQVIYCPHLDTGHFAIAHFGSFFLSIVLAGLLLYRLRLRSS
jgi:hypothetical protein